jgi:hypothetical protein
VRRLCMRRPRVCQSGRVSVRGGRVSVRGGRVSVRGGRVSATDQERRRGLSLVAGSENRTRMLTDQERRRIQDICMQRARPCACLDVRLYLLRVHECVRACMCVRVCCYPGLFAHTRRRGGGENPALSLHAGWGGGGIQVGKRGCCDCVGLSWGELVSPPPPRMRGCCDCVR